MKHTSCLILLVILSFTAQAKYKAVLVMLRAERNKTQAYLTMGKPGKAAEVQEEARKVMQVTINDFTDNFSYCPVYYFVDTNLAAVKAGRLDGILLDNKLQPVGTSPVKFEDNNYIIVYYGKPPADINTKDEKESTRYYSKYLPGDGLVVLNRSFERLEDHYDLLFIYTARPRVDKEKRYNFTSRKFSMEYREYAQDLQRRL